MSARYKLHIRRLGPACLAATLAAGGAARATNYVFATIDAPYPGVLGTAPSSINDSGQVAGYYVVPSPSGLVYEGFTSDANGGGFATLERPGYLAAAASGINNAGEIVGVSVDPSFTVAGFQREPGGTYSTIDPNLGGLASTYSEAVGINNVGAIVGFFTDPSNPNAAHGFEEIGGVYTQLDDPAAIHGTEAYSINDAGDITGAYVDAGGNDVGFLYQPGIGYSSPAIPGGGPFTMGSINNEGDYLAISEVYDPTSPIGDDDTTYIHTSAGFTPFSVPGASYTDGYSINDRGQIVGAYIASDNTIHGFSASPVPEPATWALVVLGFFGLGGVARRRGERGRARLLSTGLIVQ